MGVSDPKNNKPKFGPVIKYIAYGVILYAIVATLKIACEQVPEPPTPPLM